MNTTYLHREDARFGKAVWEKIDAAMISAAKARLAARRLLPLDGPYGPHLKAIGFAEQDTGCAVFEGVRVRTAGLQPLPAIESQFTLAMRDIAAFETSGDFLDLKPAVDAAIRCAGQEDALIFGGPRQTCPEGLLNARGIQKGKLTDWKEIGGAVNNILETVNKLDTSGFRGPYALALPPARYNLLFRRYPDGNQTEFEHLRQAVTAGIVMTSVLAAEAIVLTAVKELAALVIGQDLTTAFIGRRGRDYEFAVFESVVLRLNEPTSVCVLQ